MIISMGKKCGPKVEFDGTTTRITMSLDQMTVQFLSIAGQGNVSKGARVAARQFYETWQKEKRPAEAGRSSGDEATAPRGTAGPL